MSEAHTTPQVVPSWDLHHRLARALEFAGVKVAEMGEYLEVSPKTMTNYLNGRTRPRDGMVRSWALRCGVPYSWLRYGLLEGGDLPNPPSAWKGDRRRNRHYLAAVPSSLLVAA